MSDSSVQASLVYIVHNVLPLHIFQLFEQNVKSTDPNCVFRSGSTGTNFIWYIAWDTNNPLYHLRRIPSTTDGGASGASGGPRVEFVGVTECYVPEEERYALDNILATQFGCHPVFPGRKTAHEHYQGFCKGVLWPTMHNVIDMYNSADYLTLLTSMNDEKGAAAPQHYHESQGQQQDGNRSRRARHRMGSSHHQSRRSSASTAHGGGGEGSGSTAGSDTSDNEDATSWKAARSWNPLAQEKCWPQHLTVNAAFAHKLQLVHGVVGNKERGPSDTAPIIWVHGYELLLLPSYLLRKLPGAKVALFLDVPFPSSEIFRTLARISAIANRCPAAVV